ncbi:MAG: sugar-binding transcriptional regulator [Pseudomonadota bacterium]
MRPNTGQHDPHREMRIRAAWIYYIEGRTQNEVASALGVNRVAVTRLLSEARKRGEVSIKVASDLESVVAIERQLEQQFGFKQALVAPFQQAQGDPTRVIAAVAGPYISQTLEPNMTVGVGWGRTLHATLDFLEGKPIPNLRVVSLLGGITEAKRFNPAEFAWQFAELFDAEGFLVPAPALVDSPQTKHALLERCGLDQVFQIAESSDVAFLSCGGVSSLTTSYRLGHVSEAERQSLEQSGAVGDVLYNFVDAEGRVIDHSINRRCMSMSLERLQRVTDRVLISGGADKVRIMRATIKSLRPTTLITDEQTARLLLADPAADADAA